jgi:hypothetical protein
MATARGQRGGWKWRAAAMLVLSWVGERRVHLSTGLSPDSTSPGENLILFINLK